MTRNQAQRADNVLDEFLQGNISNEALEDCLDEVLAIPFVFVSDTSESVIDLDLMEKYTS